MENVKEKIIYLLKETKREGIEKIIDALEKSDFFEAPASSQYHGAYKGGLAEHSYMVYLIYNSLIKNSEKQNNKINIQDDSIIITSILHDLCKIDNYQIINNKYVSKLNYRGHSLITLNIIKKFILLKNIEEEIIKFHMGIWGVSKEYDFQELKFSNRDRRVSMFHIADMIATHIYNI